MGFLRLNKINFAVTPTATQLATVKYRLATLPDIESNYVSHGTNVPVLATGFFSAGPYVIDGLVNSLQYVVWVFTPCGGPGSKVTLSTS